MTIPSKTPKPITLQGRYTCQYCKKVFVLEHMYMKHECKQMKREKELKTVDGQTAWHYYQLWMRHQRRMPPGASAFTSSRYFRTFMEFVHFTKQVNLPAPEKFIWLMVQRNFTPTMWRNDDVYSIYIEWLDRKMSPLDQVKLSINTLLQVSDRKEITPDQVFVQMTAPEAIHMIRSRQLSPWLLMFSRTFRDLFLHRTSPEQRMIIENLIRPEYWAEQKDQHAADVAVIKTLVTEMGI